MGFSGAAVLVFGGFALSACYGPRPTRPAPPVDGGVDSMSADIEITSPASPTYTNKSLQIQISAGSALASPAVQLRDNGGVLTTLSAPPYTFTWDTTKVPEGSHQLVAQAVVGGQIIASAPVMVVVDRTPPAIVSKSPGSGASNVSLTDPIQVVFSEALAPTTVTADAVKLALGDVAVGSTATLGADDKTIEITISSRSSLALPGTMTEMVAVAITDLAGNAFSGASWSFGVPLWVDLGTVPGTIPQIALDPSGTPIVLNESGSLQISRHLGGTDWDSSIPPPQTTGTTASGTFAIGASGEIYVAWTESSGQPVHVARWTGSAWDRSYGTLLASATASAAGVNIALTSTGQPVVRWVEPVNMGRGPGYVSRWNGSAWTSYPGTPGDYAGPVVLDHSDLPIVLAGNQLSRWTGASWTSPQGTNVYSLAINSTDDGIGLQVESTLQPIALSTGGVLRDYVPALTGESSQNVGSLKVAINNLDEPIITWSSLSGTSPSDSQLHVARWTGAMWDNNYGVLVNAGANCSIVLAGAGIPIVAWEDFSATATHVSKSNH